MHKNSISGQSRPLILVTIFMLSSSSILYFNILQSVSYGGDFTEVSMVLVLTDHINTLNIFFAISGEKQNTIYIHIEKFVVETVKLISELL